MQPPFFYVANFHIGNPMGELVSDRKSNISSLDLFTLCSCNGDEHCKHAYRSAAYQVKP